MSALLAEMEPFLRGGTAVFHRENWRSLAENERLLGRLRNASVVLLILLLSSSSSRFAWSLLTPPPEIAPPVTAAAPTIGQPARSKDTAVAEIAALGEKLAALHLFGGADPGATAVAAAAMSGAPETTLGLVLKGLLFTTSSDRGMAVIAEKEKPGPAGLYGVGETVPGNAVIEAVFIDRVVLRRAGRLESLFLETKEESRREEAPGGPAAPIAKTKQLSRQYVEQTLANLPELSKGVQTQSHTPKGGRPGFRLMAPEGSDFLNNIGLQPGDVIYEVNGIPLTDNDGARAAFQQLRDAREVRLVFERKGVERTLTFVIH